MTFQLSGTGNPDVLVGFRGRWYVFEVKTGKGRITGNQGDIRWPIVRSVNEALQVIGAVEGTGYEVAFDELHGALKARVGGRRTRPAFYAEDEP